jgi:putative tryptophan/tyrosine transport system substrate-binding protein
MRRREVIVLVGGVAMSWPLSARAQQGERLRKIGVLMSYAEGDPEGKIRFAALHDRLGKLGWADGRNVAIETRWAAGHANLTLVFATELVTQPVDVIVAASTPVLGVVKQLTGTIPVVFTQVADPAGSGFVGNYAHPGGNITGFADYDPAIAGKWLEILKEAAPRINRVTVFFDPDQVNHQRFLRVIESSAPALKLQVAVATVHDRAEIEQAIANAAGQSDGALIVLPGPLHNTQRASIIEAAARHHLPAVYPFKYYVKDGGLLYYGADQLAQWPDAAGYVDRILKGEKPADLPVQAPTKYELVVNLKTAKTQGLAVPATLIARADEVIE